MQPSPPPRASRMAERSSLGHTWVGATHTVSSISKCGAAQRAHNDPLASCLQIALSQPCSMLGSTCWSKAASNSSSHCRSVLPPCCCCGCCLSRACSHLRASATARVCERSTSCSAADSITSWAPYCSSNGRLHACCCQRQGTVLVLYRMLHLVQ